MRTVIVAAAMILSASPFAGARERRGKQAQDISRVAVVDDEPTSHSVTESASSHDPLATGSHRTIQVSAPTVQAQAAPKEPSHPTEHAVTVKLPDPTPVAPATASKPGWLSDLEDAHGRREMKPYVGALSSCTQRKLRREPDARGTMMLAVSVGADQIAHAQVTESTLDDPQLKACLEGIVEGRTFGASNLHFTWTVKIFPRTTVAAEP